MPNFTEFSKANARLRPDPTVTVTRRSVLSFNRQAMNALDNPAGIVFLVDAEQKLLGFRPATRADRSAVAVRRPNPSQILVNAIPVLRHLNADLTEARRYPLVELDGVWCIDLKNPGGVVTSNRQKRTSPARPLIS